MISLMPCRKPGQFPGGKLPKGACLPGRPRRLLRSSERQTFLVNLINFLEKTPDWESSAVIILYDDSNGCYDHVMPPFINQSTSPADMLTGTGSCGNGSAALPGPDGTTHAQGRCGYGPRQPLLVISRWAKENFVDRTITDQTSILRFFEDNWLGR